MKKLKFVHLSDTHVLEKYGGTMLESMVENTGGTPEEIFNNAVKYIYGTCRDLDFVVISGDLVHEGSAEDYKHYRKLISESFGKLPVYLCLGNHDRRAAFRAGYLGETGDAPYYYSVMHGDSGLRIISLDSSHDNSGKGFIDREQLKWLEKELHNECEEGTLLVVHHPPYLGADDPMLAAHGLINSGELYETIRNSDVFAVMSGHTHQVSVTSFGHIPHFTADSTAFGVSLDARYMSMNDRVGLVSCTVEDRTLTARHAAFNVPVKDGFRISISELMKLMQAHA